MIRGSQGYRLWPRHSPERYSERSRTTGLQLNAPLSGENKANPRNTGKGAGMEIQSIEF